ncbi:fatty acid desaturase family protein [Rubrivirga sp.]|uniref:fatty acid desaturase family protein n=1 Tax=Rubrivirga sp. TaxID=1885344 RepID=UPI003B52AF03
MLTPEPLATRDARAALTEILGDALPPLRQLRIGRRLEDLAAFGGLWAVGLALATWSGSADGAAVWALRTGAVVASALALNAFVLLLHEGMHGVLFRSRRLNRWAAVALGATVGMSFSAYRVLHTLHHDHLGTDDDPDDYAAYTDRPVLFWAMQGLRLTVGAAIYLVAIPVVASLRGERADRVRIAQEYVVLAGLWAAALWLAPADVLVWGWLAPLPVVALMVQVRGLTQHGLTDRHDALLSSRTVRPHPVVAFLLLNENYHLEHHLFPEVPSYHLPALHRAAWAHLPRACEDTSYLGFLGRFLRQSLALDETPVGVVRREA